MRSAALYVVPALLVVTGWLSVEDPATGGGRMAVLMAIALVPALLPRWWMRASAALVALVAAAWIAVGVSFLHPEGLASRFWNGVLTFYDVRLPFDPAHHPRMHEAVLFGIFLFCLALALAIAARRPVLASLVLVVGAGWPVTLHPGSAALVRGGLILGAVLLLLAGMRERGGTRVTGALGMGTIVVACALAASTSPAIAKGEFLHWENWNLSPPDKPVSVSFVWRSNYGGLSWPRKVTDVLKIHAGPVERYWRATTLDAFRGDHWLEDLSSAPPKVTVTPTADVLQTVDSLPPAAGRPSRWVRQQVTVEHLRDNHLIGAAVPVAYQHGDFADVVYERGGVALVSPGLEAGEGYTVWSYAARPKPAQLAAAKPGYPTGIQRDDLGIWRNTWTAPFGSPLERRSVAEMIRGGRVPAPYRELYRTALQVVGHARSPYAAVVALESWFRAGGGFTYDEHPPTIPGIPPLVSFLHTRRGYCQHFAGAMALMLRYLGIPARVAVGFTSGTYDKSTRTWTVTDHDAHAWVEVWFRGYGWLPFDPTPGRGTLGAPYSASSKTFDASQAAAAVKGAQKGVLSLLEARARAQAHGRGNTFSSEHPFAVTPGQTTPSGLAGRAKATLANLLKLLALVAAGLLVAIAVLKLVRRRVRYFTRDPRRLGTACRRELVELLLDQRFDVTASSTLGEVARLLREELGIAADAFVSAAARARFGAREEAPVAAAAAREELRGLRYDLRRRLNTSERLRGAVSLRSLRAA
jgi:transglutaminase-like putative cysteine protease